MSAKTVASISACANVLLVAVLWWIWREPPPPKLIVVETNAAVRIIEKPSVTKITEPFNWQKVESEDYRQYIDNLRAIGCPEQTVRDIIIADVNALFDSRREAVLQPEGRLRFWSADDVSPFRTEPAEKLHEQFEELRRIAEEKRAVLKDLLGVEVAARVQAAFAPLNPRERLLMFLPVEKRLRVEELEQKMTAALMTKSTDLSGREQLGNYKKLKKEKLQAIESILTPGEFDEYQMRLSSAASHVRTRLGGLAPTENEFRQLVAIRQEFEERFSDFEGLGSTASPAHAERAMAERQVEEQMRKVIGPERFDQFKREQDWAYRSAVAVTKDAGIPERYATGIFEIKAIGEAEASRVRTDQSLTLEQRQNTLNEVQSAVQEAIGSVLGADVYKSYQREVGSSWLQNLNRLE